MRNLFCDVTNAEKFRMMIAMAGVLIVVMASGSVEAATIVQDTFDNPVGTATRADDAADPLDVAWWNVGTGSVSHVNDNAVEGIGADRTMVLEGGGPRMIANFSGVTLANVGDWVKLTFDMRWVVNDTPDVDLRFGLFNSNTLVVEADGQLSRTADDIGYWGLIQPDGYASTKDGSGGEALASGAGMEYVAAALVDDLENLPHTYELTITHENPTQMRIAISLDGTEIVTGLDSNINTLTFNEIGFRQTWGIDLRLDNISVTTNTNVPEPSALSLLAAGGLLLLRRKSNVR